MGGVFGAAAAVASVWGEGSVLETPHLQAKAEVWNRRAGEEEKERKLFYIEGQVLDFSDLVHVLPEYRADELRLRDEQEKIVANHVQDPQEALVLLQQYLALVSQYIVLFKLLG